MTKAKLSTQIKIKSSKTMTKEGVLLLKSSETIRIDQILGDVYLEARGQMSSFKKRIVSFVICKNIVLIKDEEFKIPFTIDISKKDTNTFEGSYVSFNYTCQVEIDVNEYDLDNVDRSLFSKIKSFVKSDDSIIVSKYFTVNDLECKYRVINTFEVLTIKPNSIFIFIWFILLCIVMIIYKDLMNGFTLFIGLFIAFFIGGALNKMIFRRLNDIIHVNIYEADNSFICSLDKITKLNLSNTNLYYEIIEQVEDNRGTSPGVYEKVIYESTKQNLKHIKANEGLTFKFPKTKGLHSVTYGDASILWRMVLVKKSNFGFKFKYTCDFEVVRVVG